MSKKGGGAVSVARRNKAKKGLKKKTADPFLKKEWYVIKLPKYMGMDGQSPIWKDPANPNKKQMSKHRFGYSPATKGKAKKAMADRVFEINLADIMAGSQTNNAKDDNYNYKNYKFIVEEVWGAQLLTQWHGMQITRDKKCSLFRKWHSLITAHCDVKTTDGFVLRFSALAFTKRQATQIKKNCYVKHSQARTIRSKMRDIIKNNVSSKNIEGLIKILNNGNIGKEIRKSCQLIFPLQHCLVEKVKVLKKPKRDAAKTLKMHDLNAAFSDIDEDDIVMEQPIDGVEEKKEEGPDAQQVDA